MKKPGFKKRFLYWLDNRISGGSMGLIRLLAIMSIFIVLLIALVIVLFQLNGEDGFLAAFWDSAATVINAWMPSFEDGGIVYLILMSLAAIAGLFITSILIGIISSGIEEKITSLKRGSSAVVEEDHIIVLGFYPGEYTLLQQLVLAAAEEPCCIVVADDIEQEEMQQYIADNVEKPKNVRIICRTVDIFDPKALERCALSACRSVIISPTDDYRTTKALLAVSAVIGQDTSSVRVGAVVSKAEYRFPPSIAEKHNVTTLQTSEVVAKIIAHSCTQCGLSETFREVFNFEGCELYAVPLEAGGMTFGELALRVDCAVPVGICTRDGIRINPPRDTVIGEGERILVFTEEDDTAKLVEAAKTREFAVDPERRAEKRPEKVTVIGGLESLDTVLYELPENVSEVTINTAREPDREAVAAAIAKRKNPFAVNFSHSNLLRDDALTRLALKSEHIVILSDYEKGDDEADMDTIFLLLNLRDIRIRRGLSFSITAEMRKEHNQHLVVTDDNTDFVVSSNMSSLILAQLAESPELIDAFRELISNRGNELYLMEAGEMMCAGKKTTAEIRRIALEQRMIVIGYIDAETRESVFNPPLNEELELGEKDSLIVLAES
ncbi:MAG: hypothetical protein IKQ92_02775 [Clostridia bacterium]|nr:hypothetical protein [Clostridia bacterium]